MTSSLTFLLVAWFSLGVSADWRGLRGMPPYNPIMRSRATTYGHGSRAPMALAMKEHGRLSGLAELLLNHLASSGDDALVAAARELVAYHSREVERIVGDCDSYGHSCWGGHGKK